MTKPDFHETAVQTLNNILNRDNFSPTAIGIIDIAIRAAKGDWG